MSDCRSGEQDLLKTGPRWAERSERWHLIGEIASCLSESSLALGVYGSMARADDEPFSDVELLGVISGVGVHLVDEWLTKVAKVKLHRYSTDRLLAEADLANIEWSLNYGKFLQLRPLFEKVPIFSELALRSLSACTRGAAALVRGGLLGEVYEILGKVRNDSQRAQKIPNGISRYDGRLPLLACRLAEQGVLLVGLWQRIPFLSRHTLLQEGQALPGCPLGLRTLCGLVCSGALADPERIAQTIEDACLDLLSWGLSLPIAMEACLQDPLLSRKSGDCV